MPRKQARIGNVQHSFVDRLRAEILTSGGGSACDLSFTEGVNLSIVIGLAYLHSEEYADSVSDEDISREEAVYEIVAQYIVEGDVHEVIKRNYGSYAESFAKYTVEAIMYDGDGLPDSEWYDENSVDEETFYDTFTAESPPE